MAKTPVTPTAPANVRAPRHVFIGHGRSLVWRDLKDFITDRLGLQYDEFNREPAAGTSTLDRLKTMLDDAAFAFLVLTAEDGHLDGTQHARENVVHEAGLFQGRLGFERAILLIEEGCAEFSNIAGLTHLSFPRGNIKAISEEIRRVLEREGILRAKRPLQRKPSPPTAPGPANTSPSKARENTGNVTMSTGDIKGSTVSMHVGNKKDGA
jgi:predicted nucleotide-binding protein